MHTPSPTPKHVLNLMRVTGEVEAHLFRWYDALKDAIGEDHPLTQKMRYAFYAAAINANTASIRVRLYQMLAGLPKICCQMSSVSKPS